MAETVHVRGELEEFAESAMEFGEAPRWHDGRLWVSDMRAHRLLAFDGEGRPATIAEFEDVPGGSGFLPDGALLVVMMRQRRVVRVDASGHVESYADLSRFPGVLLNDMVVAADGTAWISCRGASDEQGSRTDSILAVALDREARVAISGGLDGPNGLAIDGLSGALVVAETGAQRLSSYAVDNAGSYRCVRSDDVPGRYPDGITMDRVGGIWCASPFSHEVVHLSDGQVDASIALPADVFPTSCTLGGPDLRTLYITAVRGQSRETLTAWLFREAGQATPPTSTSVLAVDVEIAGQGTP